ncbi:hypothetical protein B0J13DRAFT_584931 [Dactylonectria estremocensis]|uniref:Uncharacterized protein n=1 Tax=Dactylonectria estremocensis TaxID=1079267 RepID=A0A9P9EPR1_9HYPO|nr:hypothetical protein B0J13DRAFT_584931 [Dactylonectria estremocensis]
MAQGQANMGGVVFDRGLTKPDALVLQSLAAGLRVESTEKEQTQHGLAKRVTNGHVSNGRVPPNNEPSMQSLDDATIAALAALNDPTDPHFEPTVFNGVDLDDLKLPRILEAWILRPYIRVARSIVRVETDVHIYMRGILSRRFAIFNMLFPYITDPLMGYTWNSYFYHYVKYHHRNNLYHFLHYVGRFFFLIWLDLPLYFVRKGRLALAVKVACWELGCYATLSLLYCLNSKATFTVFLLPLLLLQAGLMVGNWGQHAFVDHSEPDSDYRSSITLIDVPSNRHCFNDGYHTSHISTLLGTGASILLDDRMALLKSHVRQFTEEEIRAKFRKANK